MRNCICFQMLWLKTLIYQGNPKRYMSSLVSMSSLALLSYINSGYLLITNKTGVAGSCVLLDTVQKVLSLIHSYLKTYVALSFIRYCAGSVIVLVSQQLFITNIVVVHSITWWIDISIKVKSPDLVCSCQRRTETNTIHTYDLAELLR